MVAPLSELGCASLPVEALAVLAEFRCRPGVSAAMANGRAWVRWEPGDLTVLFRVLSVSGTQLYAARDDRWYRHGCHLPAFDFPSGLDYQPLYQVLLPTPVVPLPAPSQKPRPLPIGLVPDPRPRRTTALACGLAELARWADAVPSARLAAIQAAHCQGRALLRGTLLPLLPEGERFWGERLLIPLGRRPEPELPERTLLDVLGLTDDELVLLRGSASREGGPSLLTAAAEVVQLSAFRALDRTAIRLALREAGR